MSYFCSFKTNNRRIKMQKLRIVILSRNSELYSTKRLVAAGEARGHEMFVVDHGKCDLLIEKKKPQIYYKGKLLEGIDAVIPRIGASC